MLYTTPQQIRKIMRKLPTSITDEDLALNISKAEALVDGKLGMVYYTPFLVVPRLIQDITTDLAIFFTMESLYSSNSPNMDEYQVKRYERALKLLDEVAIGDLAIEVPMRSGHESGYASTNEEQIFTYQEPEW